MGVGPQLAIPKKSPRVALVGLEPAAEGVLRDCFKQFGIEAIPAGDDIIGRLTREKFEAIVLRLAPETEAVLEAARNSASNRKIVIYGIAGSAQEALRYSKYGINAVLDPKLERQATWRILRATHLLVVNEFRRYIRVPLCTEVKLASLAKTFKAATLEISGGGMSAKSPEKVAMGQSFDITFDLPNNKKVSVRAEVCWIHPSDDSFGMRYDFSDDRRLAVKAWIDDYLEIR
jgi:hypothetical protein